KPDAAQEKFLQNALASYQSFAEEAGDSEDVRWGSADAYRRTGDIYQKLSRFPEAEDAYRRALASLNALAAGFPSRPRHPAAAAATYHNLAGLLWIAGKPEEAEAAHGQALALRQTLAAEHPDEAAYREDLGNSHRALGSLYASTKRPREADEAYGRALAE